jgi:hypothetical protein
MARTSFNEPLKSQVFTDKLSKSLEERVTNKEAFVQNIYNLATFSNNEAFVGQMTKLTGISVAPPTPDSIIPRIAVSTDDSSFIKAKYNLNQLPLDWKFHILKFGSNQIIQELVESSSMPVLNAYSINQLLTHYLDIDKEHQFSLVAEYYIKTRALTSDQISGFFSYALEKRSFTTAQWILRRYPPDDLRLLDLLNDGKVTDVGLLKLISQKSNAYGEEALRAAVLDGLKAHEQPLNTVNWILNGPLQVINFKLQKQDYLELLTHQSDPSVTKFLLHTSFDRLRPLIWTSLLEEVFILGGTLKDRVISQRSFFQNLRPEVLADLHFRTVHVSEMLVKQVLPTFSAEKLNEVWKSMWSKSLAMQKKHRFPYAVYDDKLESFLEMVRDWDIHWDWPATFQEALGSNSKIAAMIVNHHYLTLPNTALADYMDQLLATYRVEDRDALQLILANRDLRRQLKDDHLRKIADIVKDSKDPKTKALSQLVSSAARQDLRLSQHPPSVHPPALPNLHIA